MNKAGNWRACITFFDLVLIHDSLENYYRLNMKLMTEFNMDLVTVEEMLPFERDVYVALIIEHLEKKKSDAIA